VAMIDRQLALEIATRDLPKDCVLEAREAQELPSGWYFPYRSAPVRRYAGVIINKRTGKAFRLGSYFPLQTGLSLYERGYQFETYDLVIVEVADLERTILALQTLWIGVDELEYESGIVWHTLRLFTPDELRSRLSKLPTVFGDLGFSSTAESLEQARESGVFIFEVHESRNWKRR